jgi:TonB family protein
MILEPKNSNAHLLSAFATGVALLCIGIGLHGAGAPLLTRHSSGFKSDIVDDSVMIQDFVPPAASDDTPTEATKEESKEDLEIPPLPEVTPPLTPPEMVELTPLEEIHEMPKPKVQEKKPEPAKPKPSSPPRPEAKPSSNNGGTGSSSSPVVFKGGGSGRFPSPAYPASARSAKQQGVVRLLVTVEASGIPSSVTVSDSSGFASLDSAAKDTVQRRWRWPAGDVRKYIVPVRFVLQ